MELKQLFADEDAVSPVIGVILMVAITVILAAVIGTFVLGLGENVQDSAPQANFQFEYPNSTYDGSAGLVTNVTHTGGEDIDVNTVSVQIGSQDVGDVSAGGSGNISANGAWSDPVSTGDTVVIAAQSSLTIDSGETVRVVWTSPSGGTSNTIGQSTVPS